MKKPRQFVAVVLGILVILGGGIFFVYHVSQKDQKNLKVSSSVTLARKSFEEDIRTFGPKKAFAQFKETYREVESSVAHNFAHIFGESLYTVSGLRGLSVCDTDFSYGCYHGFFVAAVSSEGLDVIPRLDAVCAEVQGNYLSCQHGIGHGILEYLGHDALTSALIACKKIGKLPPIGGCASGVFMEYNMPLLQNSEGKFSINWRPFDSARPYGQCTGIDPEFAQSCFHELPQWWGGAYTSAFSKLSALCQVVDGKENRDACFLGLGTQVAVTNRYDVKKISVTCDAMPDSSAAAICRSSAAWALSDDTTDLAGARSLCAGLSEEERTWCPH